MTEANSQPPSESEVLRQAIETFRVYSGVVLLSFAKHGQGLRDTVARNFIARGMSCTQSIYAVWRAGSEQDAWILLTRYWTACFIFTTSVRPTDSRSSRSSRSYRCTRLGISSCPTRI